ncbi:hypothetical protein ABZ922_44955 [Streptomyces shenzhenensis]|uniref:hypothetical protein n=1 Tax=Streptomyces shenzhenensis TaxID=943815 RepID=UPI0033ED2F56
MHGQEHARLGVIFAYARHYPAVSWADSFSRDAAVLAAAHARGGDPEWLPRRGRVARLLAEADRLADLVELVGITALPPRNGSACWRDGWCARP